MSRLVFKYEVTFPGMGYKFVHAYPLVEETRTHVQVRHWFGKRWHPKNVFWRVEETLS